ncbi:MAG: hypothetical protein V4617_13405 [Gemmatimonadota bacterium]
MNPQAAPAANSRRVTLSHVTRGAVALLCACALWLVVSAEEPVAEWVDVQVQLSMDSSITAGTPATPVQAYVVGRRRDLLRLRQSPPVLYRAVTDESRDSVRFELRESDFELPDGAEARVSDVRPRLLTVRLSRR